MPEEQKTKLNEKQRNAKKAQYEQMPEEQKTKLNEKQRNTKKRNMTTCLKNRKPN